MANSCYTTIVFTVCEDNPDTEMINFKNDILLSLKNRQISGWHIFDISNDLGVFPENTRGSIDHYDIEENRVTLEIESAWVPLVDFYEKLARKYLLEYVFFAEEPGFGVFVNTDIHKEYFETEFKLNLHCSGDDCKPDCLAAKIITSKLNCDYDFYDVKELLSFFEDFDIFAKDFGDLQKKIKNCECLALHKYQNSCAEQTANSIDFC